jgi:hypothetical protein
MRHRVHPLVELRQAASRDALDAVWDAAVERCAGQFGDGDILSGGSIKFQIRTLKGARPASQTEEDLSDRCRQCGKPEDNSIHVRYGNDIDAIPVKHYFVKPQPTESRGEQKVK